jgi:hypothetical protein
MHPQPPTEPPDRRSHGPYPPSRPVELVDGPCFCFLVHGARLGSAPSKIRSLLAHLDLGMHGLHWHCSIKCVSAPTYYQLTWMVSKSRWAVACYLRLYMHGHVRAELWILACVGWKFLIQPHCLMPLSVRGWRWLTIWHIWSVMVLLPNRYHFFFIINKNAFFYHVDVHY